MDTPPGVPGVSKDAPASTKLKFGGLVRVNIGKKSRSVPLIDILWEHLLARLIINRRASFVRNCPNLLDFINLYYSKYNRTIKVFFSDLKCCPGRNWQGGEGGKRAIVPQILAE